MDAAELLSNAFLAMHPEDAARALEKLRPREQAELLAQSPALAAAHVVQRLTPSTAATYLGAMDASKASSIVAPLLPDLQAAIVRSMGHEDRERLLKALEPTAAEALRALLRYPENTAGALMDPYLVTLPEDITIGDALKRSKASAQGILYYLYVIDRQRKLVGVTTLRELMRARSTDTVASVVHRDVAHLPASMHSEDIVRSPYWRDYHALPVVDERGLFLGVIRYETLHRLQDELAQVTRAGGALDTVLALGELYWMGLAAMLKGAAPETLRRVKE